MSVFGYYRGERVRPEFDAQRLQEQGNVQRPPCGSDLCARMAQLGTEFYNYVKELAAGFNTMKEGKRAELMIFAAIKLGRMEQLVELSPRYGESSEDVMKTTVALYRYFYKELEPTKRIYVDMVQRKLKAEI